MSGASPVSGASPAEDSNPPNGENRVNSGRPSGYRSIGLVEIITELLLTIHVGRRAIRVMRTQRRGLAIL